jgi:hypothetical protein
MMGGGIMIAIWENRLSTGNSIIDAEHRQVLNLLNELDVAFAVGAPGVVVERALDTLVRAIERHFARDGLPASRRGGDHAAIASTARKLLQDWRDGAIHSIDRRTLLNLGRRWICHIGRRETSAALPFPSALAS